MPAIIITGDIGAADLRRVADAGLPLLHKPAGTDRLLAAIEAALNDPQPGRRDRGKTVQTATMRILLVDDHALFRDGVALLLRSLIRQCRRCMPHTWGRLWPRSTSDTGIDLVLLDLICPAQTRFAGAGCRWSYASWTSRHYRWSWASSQSSVHRVRAATSWRDGPYPPSLGHCVPADAGASPAPCWGTVLVLRH